MQNRWLALFMILLMLVQPVVSLASACSMTGFSDQQTSTAMSALDSSTSYDNLVQKSGHHGCHEPSVAPVQTDSDKCKSCASDASCANSCSIASSIFASVFYSGDIALSLSHARYESITQSPFPQSPAEFYRPPRLELVPCGS